MSTANKTSANLNAQGASGVGAGPQAARGASARYTSGMASIQLDIPRDMEPYLQDMSSEGTFERDAMLLYPQIRNATISHGRAAEILGVRKMDLIEYYGSIGIPYIQVSEEELAQEVADFQSFRKAPA